PAQMLFCKAPMVGLGDLKGRRVRVSSAAQADFVEALGAMPVHTQFAQIVSRFESGSIDCAITGTLSGNTIGLPEFTTHLYALPLNWGMAIFGANRAAWEALPADLRDLLRRELPKLEAAVWAESVRDTAQGLACNAGKPGCVTGKPGKMSIVPATAADLLRSREIFTTAVLPRWLQRCGPMCEEVWTKTIGTVHSAQVQSQ
ncbi:MAG: ABC transporter substrate-binding protein, partial [Giesbergeria sp.]